MRKSSIANFPRRVHRDHMRNATKGTVAMVQMYQETCNCLLSDVQTRSERRSTYYLSKALIAHRALLVLENQTQIEGSFMRRDRLSIDSEVEEHVCGSKGIICGLPEGTTLLSTLISNPSCSIEPRLRSGASLTIDISSYPMKARLPALVGTPPPLEAEDH